MNSSTSQYLFGGAMLENPQLKKAASIIIRDVLCLSAKETFLIIGNPANDSEIICRALYNAAIDAGVAPSIVFQPVKTQFDYAEDVTVFALRSAPSACASISHVKLGKDRFALAEPYTTPDGKTYTSTFDYHNNGLKDMKSFWSPGITVEMFCRTASIDYALLRRRCKFLQQILSGGVSVQVTAPSGTDVMIGIEGRTPFADDGNFSIPGNGGNIPAGEVFISPQIASASGVIVFDGTVSLSDSDVIPDSPVTVQLKDGFVDSITGGETAKKLEACINNGAKKALVMEAEGKLSTGVGALYAKNARHIGELGIGLNPEATICENMLEAEKAFHTCHFAIGSNYDDDAEALIHLDCLVKNPSITVTYKNGTKHCFMKDGHILEGQ